MIGRMMVSALALTGVAYAQETPTQPAPTAPTATSSSSDRVVYEAADFAQYNPQNALDMVNQVPGFALNGGADRRGFSGAVGNLLIDGERPSTKSQGLDGILSRIPANQVVRIEVLRGAAVAGDASGQSMLVNVVRTPTAGSGTWNSGFELTSRDVPAPRGEASYSGRNGSVEWGLGGSVFSQYRDLPGWRRLYNEPGDVFTGRADTPSPRDYREATLNGNIAFPLWGGRVSATSQADWWRFHSDNDYFFFDALDNPDFALLQDFEERKPNFEIGVNYDRDFGPWSLALIGLVNRGYYESTEDDLFLDGLGALDSTVVQDIQQDTGESIARATLSRSIGPHHRIEFGGEAAFNTLDQELVFTVDGAPQTIPDSNVLVEEERAEFFGSYTWRPNDRWSLETRVAWETSTLTFTGDSNQTVDLQFLKPSIQLSHTLSGNNQVRFRVYRDVGQLDFGDFVSAAGVADQLINGGNPDLVPQTDWRVELGADLRFLRNMALGLTLTHHQISDVADLVTIRAPDPPNPDIVFDAPGNIGDAEAWSLDVNFSSAVPYIPGSRLTIEGFLWDSDVTDPLTGQSRIISNQPESRLSVNFRQDITDWKFAWGVSAFKEGEIQAYRFNEIDTSEEGPWIDLFVETTALPNNMKLRLWAANAFDGTVNRDRRFFNDVDRNGPNTSRDLRQRRFASAPWLIVELSGQF